MCVEKQSREKRIKATRFLLEQSDSGFDLVISNHIRLQRDIAHKITRSQLCSNLHTVWSSVHNIHNKLNNAESYLLSKFNIVCNAHKIQITFKSTFYVVFSELNREIRRKIYIYSEIIERKYTIFTTIYKIWFMLMMTVLIYCTHY